MLRAGKTAVVLLLTFALGAVFGARFHDVLSRGTVTETLRDDPADLSSGLIGWWTFDRLDGRGASSTVEDRSGNGNHGITSSSNGTGSTTIPGPVGQGLDLTRTQVEIADGPSLKLSTVMTLAFWIKGTTQAGFGQFIRKTPGGGNGWVVQNSGGAPAHYPDLYMRVDTSGGPGQNPCAVSNGAGENIPGVLDDTWHHVAWVLNGSNCVSYKDGVPTGTNTYAVGDGFGTTSHLYFVEGTQAAAGESYALGDVRIYNRALSADEIARLATAGMSKDRKPAPRPSS
jgi:hypothetical protein